MNKSNKGMTLIEASNMLMSYGPKASIYRTGNFNGFLKFNPPDGIVFYDVELNKHSPFSALTFDDLNAVDWNIAIETD